MSNLFFIVFAIFLLLSSFQCPLECHGHSKPNKKAQLSLPRKEVIHPHVPVGIPCYDFTPIIAPTFDGWFLAVASPASGVNVNYFISKIICNFAARNNIVYIEYV